MKRWTGLLAAAAIGVALVAGCASGTAATPTATVTVTSVAHPGASASDTWLPSELRGRWCTREGDRCLDGAQLIAEYPDTTIDSVEAVVAVPGAVDYTICLGVPDHGSCGVAMSEYLRYFPVGVGWDCVAVEVVGEDWPGCAPDFTAAHDVTRPRVVVLLNHQQDTMYEDSEPLYRSPA